MGIIEKYAKKSITLKLPSNVITDGKRGEIAFDAVAIESGLTRDDFNEFGALANGKVFYVAPTEQAISLPCVVVADGVNYNVRDVRKYETLAGEFVGWKVVVYG